MYVRTYIHVLINIILQSTCMYVLTSTYIVCIAGLKKCLQALNKVSSHADIIVEIERLPDLRYFSFVPDTLLPLLRGLGGFFLSCTTDTHNTNNHIK